MASKLNILGKKQFNFLILFFCLLSFTIHAHDFKILVFTKTAGFTHSSIEEGTVMLEQLGIDNDFDVDITEDASLFTLANLQQYGAVVFLSTTGDVLNDTQQTAFEQYIQGGGGYVGIHAASDTEYDWPWYGDLVGAYFSDHPPGTHQADIKVSDRVHPSTENLPFSWTRTDEWYNFQENPRGDVHVLATLDETSYSGGTMGYDHPIIWSHEYDGGRAWYTAGGHTEESFSEPLFVAHVLGGIYYATNHEPADLGATIDQNFDVSVIENNPSNPMALAVLPDNKVLYIERSGNIKLYNPETGTITIVANFDVDSNREDGLLGIVLDPNFETNNWLYVFYSPTGDEDVQHLSRLTFTGTTIDTSTEEILMVIPVQREECCHSGGDLEFDKDGNLYISLGDNINPFVSDGYTPIDEGTHYLDAQGTSANTKDYRGKILRIKPEDNGTYSIPAGNLFTDANEGYPEIYTMGHRNPFRIAVGHDDYLYVGEVGPDSNVNNNNRGPRGHDEFNRTNVATNFGWPYCIADNQSYVDYNFETGVSGNNFDCDNPVNTSINNTGATNLPAASSAWIWYHDGVTDAFPAMGTGSGRTAMAGAVYEYNNDSSSEAKFPEYYDNSIFIYEWARNWIREVKVDDTGNIVSINPFLESLSLNRPIDMDFGPDGSMYIIEWGTGFGGNNADSRIIKISFKNGNRTPNAIATADPIAGTLPLTVNFDAQDSFDPDPGDNLSYDWDLDGDGTFEGTGVTISNTYTQAGTYSVQLRVTDSEGLTSFANLIITAGNSVPEVTIENPVNGGFFIWGETIDFTISVFDEEDGTTADGSIDCGDVSALASIGHDDHSHDLNANENCEDSFTTQTHGDEADNVFYVLRGTYIDNGASGVGSITESVTHILQPKVKEAEHYTTQSGIELEEVADPLGGGVNIGYIEDGDYVSFDPMNLQGINHITFRGASASVGGTIEVRIDAVDGPLLGSRFISSTGDWQAWDYFTMPIQDPGGTHELFFVFKGGSDFLFNINWIEFHGQGVASDDSAALKGLEASYYSTTNFTGTPIVTKDPMIAFNWEDGSPISGINSDTFSVRWEGFLEVEETGNYELYTNHSGGNVKVEVNGSTLINENTNGAHSSSTIALTAGEKQSIVVEYVNTNGSAAISLGFGENNTIHQSYFSIDNSIDNTCSNTAELIEAECFDDENGVQIEASTEGGDNIGFINNGSWTMYQNIDLTNRNTIQARVASETNGGTIEVRLNSIDGELISTLDVSNTDGWQNWETVSSDISFVTGVQDIYFVYTGDQNVFLFNVNWFKFVESDTITGNFIPDPNKTYYIDSPHHDLRLAADGESEDPYTTTTNTTGEDVEWRFVQHDNGYWHIQRAAGGATPRLRTDNSVLADMQETSFSGTYTYYEFTEGYIDNTFFVTLPNGPSNYQRLQVNNQGTVRFVPTSHALTWESFRFTEAGNVTTMNSIIIQENEEGFCNVEGSVDSNNTSFTSNGYANTDNAIGNGIEWEIDGPAGDYTFTWRYASSSENRPADLLVNGDRRSDNIPFELTGDWSVWATQTVTSTLTTGVKTIRLEPLTSSGLVNIDYLMITGPDVSISNCIQSDKNEETDPLLNGVIIDMYPVPFTNELTIALSEDISNGKVEIIDASGSIRFTKNITNTSETIDLSSLASGFYIVKITGVDTVYHKSIIKQ